MAGADLPTDESQAPVGHQRVDKWLFFARIAKSRSLAQKLVRDGHVRLNGNRLHRPSVEVGAGDKIEVSLQRRTQHLIVVAPGNRRGPYSEASTLYRDVSPPPEARDTLTAFEQAQRLPGSGRPTKKQRRDMDRFRDSDSEER